MGHFWKTEHLCLWALCFLKCVGVSCDAPCQLLHWVTPQGRLLPGLPCSDHLKHAGTLLLRRYATTNSYKQSMHTHEPNTYFNNYSNQQWSWVSNKDLEISIQDYYRRKCEQQCWVGIWFVNKHQFTFIKYFRTSVWYFSIHWRRMLHLQTNSLDGSGSVLIQPFKGGGKKKTYNFGKFSLFY